MIGKLFGSGPKVPEIDVREAHRRMTEDNALLLDVREADELKEAAVPGALHIPLGLLNQKGSTLPKDRDLLVFCRSGQRSALATDMLQKNGYSRAVNVTGGIIAWHQAQLPID